MTLAIATWCDSWSGSLIPTVGGSRIGVQEALPMCWGGWGLFNSWRKKKWKPKVNVEGFQYRQDCKEEEICTKPKLRMYLGIVLVLKTSNHVCFPCYWSMLSIKVLWCFSKEILLTSRCRLHCTIARNHSTQYLKIFGVLNVVRDVCLQQTRIFHRGC